MTVVSDGTLRQEIAAKRLILDGDSRRATHCTYEFTPAKIFPGGATENELPYVFDWTGNDTTNARFVVQPGAVVWIRVRERVAMPTNMCGLWLQTNTLSRKGLLLINASLVEPGYEGHLSCHFVNFSKEPVEIFPNTALVKLLFMKLDRESAEPFTQRITNYDTMIAGLASRSAKSFLQISEITARLEDARKNAELDLKRVGELESQRLKNQLDSDSRQRRMDEIEAIKKDVESYVRRALGAAAAGVILLGLIMLGVQWLHSRITIDEAGLDQRIERSLGRHVTFVGANPSLQPATTSFPLRDAGSVTVPTANDQ